MSPEIKVQDIRLLSQEQLVTLFKELSEPAFRGRQVYEWLWKKGARSFDEMTNLPLAMREKLATNFQINALQKDVQQVSEDGTIKCRFKLHDGFKIEAVLIPVPRYDRYTVCVSTQVGCSLTCSFCATGKMKRERNLDPGEIYDQVHLVGQLCQETYDHPLTNIVYMGMGEPLLNYANVLASVELITSPEGLGMSPKRITVSTAGIAKMIRKLADDKVKFNLALSLHAADDEKRNEIMPINNQNDLATLYEALTYFKTHCKSKLTFEYIAFANFNDGEEDARALVKFAKGLYATVNIIEYNQVAGVKLTKSTEDRLDRFAEILSQNRVSVTIRRSRGKDIDAACGQLANKG